MFSGRIDAPEVRCRGQTKRHTDRHGNYRNPRCACAPRFKYWLSDDNQAWSPVTEHARVKEVEGLVLKLMNSWSSERILCRVCAGSAANSQVFISGLASAYSGNTTPFSARALQHWKCRCTFEHIHIFHKKVLNHIG